MTFAGPAADGRAARTWSVTFRCPVKDLPFSEEVPVRVGADMRILSVTSESADAASAPPTGDWRDTELAEWIKTSSSTARDFGRTMITSGLAAIPVYFAILKSLGFETVRGGGLRVLAVAPPFLLLTSLFAFVLTLRPVFQRVDRDTLASLREQRLAAMNRWITVGVALFGVAVFGAVVVFVVLVWR